MADGDPQRPKAGGEAGSGHEAATRPGGAAPGHEPAAPAPPSDAAPAKGAPAPPRDAASANAGSTLDASARVAGAFTDVAVKVIAALGTTAGFITLVAGTGGAVMLARFWAAGLPADQALAAMPRNDLVAAGAATLGLFTLLGLVAVAGVYAIDAAGRATKSMRVGLSALVGAEIICAVLIATDDFLREGIAVVWCLGLVGVAFYVRKTGRFLEEREPDPPTLADLRDARERERLGGDPLVREPRRQLKSIALVIATVVAVLSAGLGWIFYGQAVAAAVIVSSGLAAICFGVAEASGTRFWPYALSVFFSIALFGAVFSTWRLAESPKLNPVALLRVSEGRTSAVIGLLVARREDLYWLGAVSLQCEDGSRTDQGVRRRGRIFSIPRSEVRADEIGALIHLKDADNQARALLRELIRRHPEAQDPGSKAARIVPGTLQPPAVSSCSGDEP